MFFHSNLLITTIPTSEMMSTEQEVAIDKYILPDAAQSNPKENRPQKNIKSTCFLESFVSQFIPSVQNILLIVFGIVCGLNWHHSIHYHRNSHRIYGPPSPLLQLNERWSRMIEISIALIFRVNCNILYIELQNRSSTAFLAFGRGIGSLE